HLFEPVVTKAAADPTDNFEPDPFTFYAPDPEAGIVTDFYLSERLAGKDVTVTLFSAAREELKSVQAEAASGFNRVVIDSGDLEPGSYTIELKAGRKTASADFSIN
ncbi:MAG: hypothetical protein ABR519_05245, partial [Bacteroidales bacterium]